jgi:hypothetical protein
MASLALALSLLLTAPVKAATAADDPRQEAWRETMAATQTPGHGCFRSDYPNTAWIAVSCVATTPRPLHQRDQASPFSVGNGNDYSAVTSGLISSTVGSFPLVSGVKSEKGFGQPNVYSLQINSQFFASPVCAGAATPASCLGWEQFVYDSLDRAAYMQYWLINYGSKCPPDWISYSGDCYMNSAAVSVPQEVITALHTLKLSGKAVAGGLDTLVFTAGAHAYSTTGADSVVDLAGYWNASEWNIFGDGDGSAAVFNVGTSIKVKIALTDGTKTAPTCVGKDGTTGETNNLMLGPCVASPGAKPSVVFTESLLK